MIDAKGAQAVRRLVLLAGVATLGWTTPAAADVTIDDDRAVPEFNVEVEPHGIVTPFWPPRGSADAGFGLGALVGINVAPRGFIPTVADTVSIGLGLDWVRYVGGRPITGECAEWVGDPGEEICVRTRGGGGAGTYVFAPAVMQWSFYLNDTWSFFGEPGLGLYFYSGQIDRRLRAGVMPVFNLGARYHFSERAALTMRMGYPYTSIGISLYF